jgi:CDP-diacylglycerol--glycerol-3-phosphate 3-phosphatidyltransferase
MNKKQIPNFLTSFRLFIIPILIMSFFITGMIANVIAATLFAIAAITDYFDGYFARVMKAQSNFGKCLDPIADKLLVIVAIVMLIYSNHGDLWILIPGLIIICREVLVSGLREFLSEFHVDVPVSKLAKIKTGVQMIAITGLILGEDGSSYAIYNWLGSLMDFEIKYLLVGFVTFISKILFIISSLLTVLTGYSYLKIGIKNM